MEIIDNVNALLGDDLKKAIRPGAKVKIAASTFSIFAFEALKKELSKVESLEFIFTSPTFVAAKATDRLQKERREFFIPQAKRESSLYGSEFEIQLRNKLTQRAIARECAAWVRTKATFRSNSTKAPMQQFATESSTVANCCIGALVLLDRNVALVRTHAAHSRAMARWVSLLRSWISNSDPYRLDSRFA